MPLDQQLVLACGASAAAGAVVAYLTLRARGGLNDPDESRRIYETKNSTDQYMEFHYTPGEKTYVRGLKNISEAFDFPVRLGRLFAEFKPANAGRALDLGCAVGASAFEMTKVFDETVGIDLSEHFIDAANQVKAKQTLEYEAPEQGLRTLKRQYTLPADVKPEKARFLVGDALNVDPKLGSFDGLLAANLLCRVPNPRKLLDSFTNLVNPGGILVISSPYSWWAGATNPDSWIGGRPGDEKSEELAKAILSENFELLSERDEPFMIRDHTRRYQVGFSHCTIWRRKAKK